MTIFVLGKRNEEARLNLATKNGLLTKKKLEVMTKVNENSGIRNMRSISLRRLYFQAGENVARSEVALMNLKEAFEDGKIPACKARKEAAHLISFFEIDVIRYNKICSALMSAGTLTIGHTLISTISCSVINEYRFYFA